MARKLTARQKAFIKEYLIDLNATQAAIRAGYSEKTAKEIGFENLTKPHIAVEIEVAMKHREKNTEKTAEDVVKQLVKIAFADVKDFVEWDSRGNVKVKPADQIDGTLVAEISSNETDTSKNFKFKRNDQLKALELLGKHFGMFTDKVKAELSGPDGQGINVVFNIPRPPKE